jgi:phage I-like protein
VSKTRRTPTQNTPSACCVAALVFELTVGPDGVTNEAHLLPPGPFRAVDGRPKDCTAWRLDYAIAESLIARMRAKANDTLIDFEHQSLRTETNGKRVEAAGWFRDMEWRDSKGLYAINVQWVGDTATLIKDKKLRYVSAVFLYSYGSGEVLEIVSVALTTTHPEDAHMATEEQLAALTAQRDTLNTQLAALTAERDGLKTSTAALTAEVTTLKAKVEADEKARVEAALVAEKAKHAELVTAALSDGRLTPAEKGFAEKLPLASLTEMLEVRKPLNLAGGRQGGGSDAGANGLSTEELAMCTRMGVSPEDYAKTNKPGA